MPMDLKKYFNIVRRDQKQLRRGILGYAERGKPILTNNKIQELITRHVVQNQIVLLKE